MIETTIINADVYAGLRSLEDSSIDVAVTSPPYWGQRDYGFNGQIGNEEKPEEYIEKLVIVFGLLRNKLKKDGVFFLNIGDKYISKYGKTPLGMIPYRLAYQMAKDGWLLEDTIIWYKPNHMPSSIKNRFVNSYEPIFVFTRYDKNLYQNRLQKNSVQTNIMKVNLQPTTFKHIATFPEKLIESLFKKVDINERMHILDPFAGSGTTLKAAQNLGMHCKCSLIDSNQAYIDIIIERCKLESSYKVLKEDYVPYYQSRPYASDQLYVLEGNALMDKITITKKGLLYIADSSVDYYKLLGMFNNRRILDYLQTDSVCFIGSRCFDLDLIYRTSLIMEYKWVIRNMIIIEEDDKWFPIFMIVDDNKKYRYHFDYKKLSLKSKTEYGRKWKDTNFVGFPVYNNLTKEKSEGVIVEVCEYNDDDFPLYVIVKWDNGKYSKEYVVSNQDEVMKSIAIDKDKYYIKEKYNYTLLDNIINHIDDISGSYEQARNNYNGKYKTEKRINWGASPGARNSVEEEYFSLQRLYEVDQAFISDYLNCKRKAKGLSKKELTELFPPEYQHTVGHWLRNDFGGSIPNLCDWQKLVCILDLDEEMTNYVCKTGLKIQTVKNGEYKAPDDYLIIKDIGMLYKLID